MGSYIRINRISTGTIRTKVRYVVSYIPVCAWYEIVRSHDGIDIVTKNTGTKVPVLVLISTLVRSHFWDRMKKKSRR